VLVPHHYAIQVQSVEIHPHAMGWKDFVHGYLLLALLLLVHSWVMSMDSYSLQHGSKGLSLKHQGLKAMKDALMIVLESLLSQQFSHHLDLEEWNLE